MRSTHQGTHNIPVASSGRSGVHALAERAGEGWGFWARRPRIPGLPPGFRCIYCDREEAACILWKEGGGAACETCTDCARDGGLTPLDCLRTQRWLRAQVWSKTGAWANLLMNTNVGMQIAPYMAHLHANRFYNWLRQIGGITLWNSAVAAHGGYASAHAQGRHWYAHTAEAASTKVKESRAAAKVLAKVLVATQAVETAGMEMTVFMDASSEYAMIRYATKYAEDDDFYFIVNVMLFMLLILLVFLFLAGQAVIRLCRTGGPGVQQLSSSRRSVACQSQVTYLRKRETPRFQPLPDYGHGVFEMVKE